LSRPAGLTDPAPFSDPGIEPSGLRPGAGSHRDHVGGRAGEALTSA